MHQDEKGRRWKSKSDEKRDQYLEKKVMEAEQTRQEEAEETNPSASIDTGARESEEQQLAAPKMEPETNQNAFVNLEENEAETSIGNNQNILKIAWENKVLEPPNSCSRVGAGYIYKNQLVSKRYSNKSKQIIKTILN